MPAALTARTADARAGDDTGMIQRQAGKKIKNAPGNARAALASSRRSMAITAGNRIRLTDDGEEHGDDHHPAEGDDRLNVD